MPMEMKERAEREVASAASLEDLRRFLEFLIRSGACTVADLKRVVRLRQGLDTRIGQLATLRGWMSMRDVLQILIAQVECEELFGNLCISANLLSPSQRDELLHVQSDPLAVFCECLALSGVLDEARVKELRARFSSASRPAAAPPEAEPPSEGAALAEWSPRPCRRTPAEVKGVLKKLGKLASLPEVVNRVLSMLQEPECRLENVAKVIQADQMIATSVLRLVNSSMYSMRGRISSITKALVILGVRAVRQVVLSAVVANRFDTLGRERARALWKHGIRTSRWAGALAARERYDPEEVFTAGIIHEFGLPILHQSFPEEMQEVMELVRTGVPQLEAEAEVFGMTHADVGGFLSRLWTFSPAIAQSVLYHHVPVAVLRGTRDLSPVAAWVNAGCRLADTARPGDFAWPGELDAEFLSFHRLEPDFLLDTGPRVHQEAEELGDMLF